MSVVEIKKAHKDAKEKIRLITLHLRDLNKE